MWVVKLGGSMIAEPELKSWLDMLAQQGDGRIIIVPGGGMFADTVRLAQQNVGFDNATAHHMALLAMEQYGLVLQSMQPDLVTVTCELEIAERSWQHRTSVWMPSRMVLADDTVPQNWDVTSDSLAAWLAEKIGADRLILVKQVDVDSQPIASLVEEGVLDAAFTDFAARISCPIHIMHKAEYAEFSTAFAGGSLVALAF